MCPWCEDPPLRTRDLSRQRGREEKPRESMAAGERAAPPGAGKRWHGLQSGEAADCNGGGKGYTRPPWEAVTVFQVKNKTHPRCMFTACGCAAPHPPRAGAHSTGTGEAAERQSEQSCSVYWACYRGSRVHTRKVDHHRPPDFVRKVIFNCAASKLDWILHF